MTELIRRCSTLAWQRDTLSPQTVGWMALGTSVLTGSTYSGFAKQVSGALSPVALLFVSEGLMLLFLLASFGALPIFRKLLRLERRQWQAYFLLAAINGIAAPLIWFTGLQYTTGVNASLFASSDILFTVLLASVVLREPIRSAHVSAMLCMTLGIFAIVLQGFTAGITFQSGDLLILVATFLYSVGSILYRKYLHHSDPMVYIFLRSFVGMAFFFVISPFLSIPLIQEAAAFPAVLVTSLLGFAFISRFVYLFSFYQAIDRLPISTVSLFSSLSVVGGAVFAFLLIGESLRWYHFVGGALIILGTILFELISEPAQQHARHHTKRSHL